MTLAILAAGQSNMEGAYGPALPVPAHGYAVQAYNLQTQQWATAQLGVSPFRNVVGSTLPAHNLAYEAAHQLALRCRDNVSCTLLASGGKRIEYFLPNYVLTANNWGNTQTDPLFGASLSDEVLGATGAARNALNAIGKSRYDAFFWQQGEANFGEPGHESAQEYAAKLTALLSELTTRGFITEKTPVMLGEINPRYVGAALHASALATIAASDTRVRVVPWLDIEDVAMVTGVNNPHATGRGLAKLGQEFAALAGAELIEVALA